MNSHKPRIVDQFSPAQCLQIVEEAEKRAKNVAGDRGATFRDAIKEAKRALISIEHNEKLGKTASKARDNLDQALTTIFEISEKKSGR